MFKISVSTKFLKTALIIERKPISQSSFKITFFIITDVSDDGDRQPEPPKKRGPGRPPKPGKMMAMPKRFDD